MLDNLPGSVNFDFASSTHCRHKVRLTQTIYSQGTDELTYLANEGDRALYKRRDQVR